MPLSTVKIHELNPRGATALSLSDEVPVWRTSDSKTIRVPLNDLLDFFTTGGVSTSHAPVSWGGMIQYVVPAGTPAGATVASIPSLAGKDFVLLRGFGKWMEPLNADNSNASTADFDVLDAGGFQLLKAGDALHPGEEFVLVLFSLIGTSSGSGGSTSTSAPAFIKGKKSVSTNTTLDPLNDLNKVIQLRGGATQITLTLPDIADCPEGTTIPIEADITNSKQNIVSAKSGQLIYMLGTSRASLIVAPGEVLWLFRDTDGWYVINDFYRNYLEIGNPVARYKAGVNELVCNGQLVSRADYPRLWEWVQSLGSSLVSDATWSSGPQTVAGRSVPQPYVGCFSTGDGSTTFRVPNLLNSALRGLKTESGSDTERYFNGPGGFQLNEVKSHQHDLPNEGPVGTDRQSLVTNPNADEGFNGANLSAAYGGAETRMDNVGVLWCLRT